MATFLYENGDGKVFDEHGKETQVYEMEIDNGQYPLERLTTYDQYIDLKPPEKTIRIKIEEPEEEMTDRQTLGHRIASREYRLSLRKAAAELKIPPSTVQGWKKKFEDGDDVFTRKEGSDRPRGRSAILKEEHQKHLIELIDENPSLVLDQMMESLTSQFENLKVSRTLLYDFIKKKYNISVKRAYFHSVERNNPEKIKERKEWAQHWWKQTDMYYMSNCVFIDESGFNINMNCSIAWVKKGERAIVTVPKTRANNITILGAIASYGVVNISVRRPKRAEPSKKRKVGGAAAPATSKGKGGTVTGCYFNFVAATLDVLDLHEQFKGHYIVMDNAPIHTHQNIQKYIEQRDYSCIYLPPYSPELNPIELFWSVCKSKLKREKLLKEETLTSIIGEACNNIYISNLQGFCRYSESRFQDCLDEKPL
ncbi:hypothetical protein RMATCC62417_18430 [Rhizopus microsporus]|nr:hypothetical protein RMATCC62417_18430 [Rhizopus microsporus]